MQLEKSTNVTAASFSVLKDRLTTPQKALIKLMCDRMSEGMPISSEDVKELYLTTMKPKRHYEEWIRRYNYETKEWYYNKEIIDKWTEYGVQARATQWFKNNLASCIIKGKIMAIPIIDIE